jgi:hypothetical protein
MSERQDMYTVQTIVTPEIASKWLEGNVRNRPIRQRRVEHYADQMKRGWWRLTHQGIAFASDGQLIDGQHRLWAIVEAGISVPMLVTYNLTKLALDAVDGGQPRDAATQSTLAHDSLGYISKDQIATLNVLRFGADMSGAPAHFIVSAADVFEAFPAYADAIRFAHDALPNRKLIATAPVRAVLARAFYSHDQSELRTFGAILHSGASGGEERDGSVITLRNWLLDNRGNSQTLKRVRYGKTERALMAYLNGEPPITRLFAATREMFPLPSEVASAAYRSDAEGSA